MIKLYSLGFNCKLIYYQNVQKKTAQMPLKNKAYCTLHMH